MRNLRMAMSLTLPEEAPRRECVLDSTCTRWSFLSVEVWNGAGIFERRRETPGSVFEHAFLSMASHSRLCQRIPGSTTS